MNDKLMKILYDDSQNYPSCRLQLVVKTFVHPNNQNSKVPKVVRPMNKETLGTSVINSPMSIRPALYYSLIYGLKFTSHVSILSL